MVSTTLDLPLRRGDSQSALAVLDDPLEQDGFTRWLADGQAESALQLSGMHCSACAGIIEQALLGLDGVTAARVSAASQRATVCWDPARTRPSAMLVAIGRAGYAAVPDVAAPARALRMAEHRNALWRLFVASFCAMQVMMFATPSYVAAPGELADDLRALLNWGSWLLTLPVLCFSALPFFKGAWHGLRQRRIGMDTPVACGIIAAFVASSGATFDPNGLFGHEVYFDSLTMFVSFLLGARYVEMLARHRAAVSLEAALARMPETALRLEASGAWAEVSVQRLRPGQRVRVSVGQAFPADGVLACGATSADESLLTGESSPVPKADADAVVAGSINLLAPVEMIVQRVGADTRYQAIVAMMRDAMTQRPAAARAADRWAGPFLGVVLALAALAAVAWSFIDPARAVGVAVSVLIVTCPCALSLAVPAALVAAARQLAQRGVLIQRIDAIETLARTRRMFIDKTGTLTDMCPALRRTVACAADMDEAAALAIAASLSQWSQHPLSRALMAAAPPPVAMQAWHDVQEQPGAGLQALDAHDVPWRLGSAAWVGAPGGDDNAQVWLTRQGLPVAQFEFEEGLREGVAQALVALRAAGMHLTLLSGDAPARAQAMAQRLGFDEVVGGASPAEKLAAVAAAQAGGAPVAMVGDGINDAPVLARADVALAMGQGALVARVQADAVIVSNRLMDLVAAVASARQTMRIVRQNLLWAALYNAACVPLALFGLLPPWAAGLGMAGSSLAVILNALRAGR